jgi:hypothetical protein
MHCAISPLASFIPTIFSTSFASLSVVAAVMFLPVLPGTLYRSMGFGDASASAL